MKLGIVGLPNVGKSTLFNAITGAQNAQAANYPFCTIEPNVSVVSVPDRRLDVLAEMYSPRKLTPAAVEFLDIAGLVRGASKGEGLGNKFLSHIRQVDAVVHVVRCFDDENIVHVDGGADPARDIETVGLELILSDIELVERRLDKTNKLIKGDRRYQHEAELLSALLSHLGRGLPARTFSCAGDDREIIDSVNLLSQKPVIYAANMDEAGFSGDYRKNSYFAAVAAVAEAEQSRVLPICAKLEEEMSGMEPEEKQLFLSELGLSSSGLDRLIALCYSLLGLISYLTAGAPEVRAWTIKDGTKAPQAAGKIHSDFERGFIRAEVIPFDELVQSGSMSAAREKGLVRSEGKDYVMRDGDVVLFRFNV